MCLVIGECLIQKAAKLYKNIEKWGDEMGLSSWLFLKDFFRYAKKNKRRT